MTSLPPSPDLAHLRKQARHLLRDVRAGKAPALTRIRDHLPAMRGLGLDAAAFRDLKLHDAQSAIAREYGFRSWVELKRFVEWKRIDRRKRIDIWLKWAFEGQRRELLLAARLLREEPDLFAGDAWLACVTGDEATLRAALARDPAFANRPGGPPAMPPLAAVSHSRLILLDGFAAPLIACARLLIAHGADVDASWDDPRWPDNPLSVLYGAAGGTHHPGMTALLLEAGADPNDNESLYHSVEAPDLACTRLLLEAGARLAGTNAIGRALDYDRPETLRLLLRHGDAREGPWLHHAIRRGRSLEQIAALIEAGADPAAADRDGISLYRRAAMHGRGDVLGLLHERGITEPLNDAESFVAACARADTAAARALLAREPAMIATLDERQLQAMPLLAGLGAHQAVRTMLALGWPREVTAEWHATALNLAVYQGDAAMARLLLEAGADWRTRHGFGDNVLGTLSHASQAEDLEAPPERDFPGCAAALLDHGVPVAAFEAYRFADAVEEYLDARRAATLPQAE